MYLNTSFVFMVMMIILLMTLKSMLFKKHFLLILISLEIMMLLNLILTFFYCMSMSFYLMFFCLAVAEACAGLSIMIFLNRRNGDDLVSRI